jgi:uncharacterized ParB-like nuclease family protein
MKTFQDWLRTVSFMGCSKVYIAEQAWNACADQYKHTLANKEQAIKLNMDAIDLLKKKNEELQKEFDACHRTKNILRDTHEKLEARLKDAEEVIALYANYSSWNPNPDNDEYCDVITLTDSEPIDTTFNKDCDIGGKRAREYQKKYMEGK